MPLSFIIGFLVAMPLHEFLHAISYPKGAKVYIGVSLKQLRAYAASSAALSRGRYIMMSLAPLIPGIIFLAVFVVCPISMKWLMTICVVPSFMGLISPAPDYMEVLIILRKVPKGAMIQATENGLVWYEQIAALQAELSKERQHSREQAERIAVLADQAQRLQLAQMQP